MNVKNSSHLCRTDANNRRNYTRESKRFRKNFARTVVENKSSKAPSSVSSTDKKCLKSNCTVEPAWPEDSSCTKIEENHRQKFDSHKRSSANQSKDSQIQAEDKPLVGNNRK